MCGILGYFGNYVSNFIEQTSLENIKHRGPDFQDEIAGDNYFLGHTRLSILDTSSAGNQPMYNADKSAVIIFNGEIYNHLDLRNSKLKGKSFKSTSDTETLLYGLDQFGEEFINELNGIFAFAYLDLKTNYFIIARDHFGVKPLYYFQSEHEIYFSSEMKAIIPNLAVRTLDESALRNYINFLWSPGELTPFKEVKKLLPGHYIKGNLDRIDKPIFYKYYKVPFDGIYTLDSETILISTLEEKLLKAVERQMLSDVPLGFFLSGGLDSSILVAMARKLFPDKKIQCYTIRTASTDGFEDDLRYAKKVAEHLNVNLKIVDADTDILQYFDKIIYHLDEPQADPAPINVYNICTEARKDGIKVLIGGTAGDDLFSGYRRHQALRIENSIDKVPTFLRKCLKGGASLVGRKSNFGRRLSKIMGNIEKPKNQRLLGYFSWLNTKLIDRLFIKKQTHNYYQYFERLNAELDVESSDLNRMLYWEMNTFLPDHNLNYTDKLSMATGVEVRVPFLDIELVKFSTTIPPSLKLKGNETKYILKKVAEKYLPHEVIYRPKTGFGAPVRDWITNKMTTQINDYLSKSTIEKRGIFDYNNVMNLIEKNKKGSIDASYPIWSLLAIESWIRQFDDKN